MVFKSVSWQAFLVAALALASIWYLVVLPLLYRRQLKDWLGGRNGRPDLRRVSQEWDEELEEEALGEADEVMGQSKIPEGVSRVAMNMFGFAPDVSEEVETREVQQSLVPDVIEELKRIFWVLERDNGGKDEFISLFALVKAKYSALRGTPSQRALNEYIREHALFPISDDELTHLWN